VPCSFAWFLVAGMRVALPCFILQIPAFPPFRHIITCKIRSIFNFDNKATYLNFQRLAFSYSREQTFFSIFFLHSSDLCLGAQVSNMQPLKHYHSLTYFYICETIIYYLNFDAIVISNFYYVNFDSTVISIFIFVR